MDNYYKDGKANLNGESMTPTDKQIDSTLEEEIYDLLATDKSISELADAVLTVVNKEIVKARRVYTLKGADTILEDLSDWMDSKEYSHQQLHQRISTMRGSVAMKELNSDNQDRKKES